MRKFLFLLIIIPAQLFATNYYFSSTGSNSNNGLTPNTAWASLSKFQTVINNGTVNIGDSILWKRNDIFSGSVIIQTTRGGSAANGVIMGAYGTGAKPIFLYSGSGSNPDDRITMLFIGVDNWRFKDLHFTDTDHSNDKTTGAWCGFPLYMGSGGEAPVNGFVFDGVDIDYCGMGYVFYGDNNIVKNSSLTNFKDLNNNNAQSDYGANPFTLLDGNSNQFLNNYVSGGWAASDYFGFNGGFCEMFGSCSNNVFMYNTIVDCNGVSEFGANGATALATNNTYAYNKVTNSGAAFYCNISGPFAMQVANVYVYNNVIIEQNGISRYTGSNLAAGLTGAAHTASIASPDGRSFGYNTNPSATYLYILKNNIFKNNTAMDICNSGTTKTSHDHNLFQLSNGSVPNVTLAASDVSSSSTLFVNQAASDAASWDLTLITGSPAIGTGQTVPAYPTDFAGRPINNNMGIYGPYSAPTGNDYINFPITIGGQTFTSIGP